MNTNSARPPSTRGTGAGTQPTANIQPADDDQDPTVLEAQSLVRSLNEQRVAETDAYWRGWRDCYATMRALAADDWQAGWNAAEDDMAAEWAEVARKVRALGSPDARSFDERRTAELAACKPKPGDFPGLDNDPHCLEPMRASIESIARANRSAA